MGPRMVLGLGTGIAPPSTHRYTPPRVHPSPPHAHGRTRTRTARSWTQSNMVVGLRSVDQLSLDTHFSDIEGITEVYNLTNVGNPNDHNVISGTK